MTSKNQVVEKIRGLIDNGQNIFRKRTVNQLLMAYDELAVWLEEAERWKTNAEIVAHVATANWENSQAQRKLLEKQVAGLQAQIEALNDLALRNDDL